MMNLSQKYGHVRQHYDAWWQAKGSVLNINITEQSAADEYDNTNWKAAQSSPEYYKKYHTDAKFNAAENLARIDNTVRMGDTLPLAMSDYGTISLAAYLGCRVEFGADTVWYYPFMEDSRMDEALVFDPNAIWWQKNMAILAELKQYEERVFIGSTAMSPGLDCLYQIRGAEALLMDLASRPSWVHEKLQQIQQAYFQAFDLIYQQIKREDGSMVFGYFSLWGQGKTTQVQCDVSALISPAMFQEFELPYLTNICNRMENTLYHLDGTQAMVHLDSLLAIPTLNGIEWSPQAGIETGGNQCWYSLYEKILSSGKALQVVEATAEETVQLFRHFGSGGINVMTAPMTVAQAEWMLEQVEQYR